MRIPDQTVNRLKVLKAIRRHAPLSRSDLPALTGLSSGTITQATRDLVRRQLLLEAKEQAKRRNGRPRTFLQINAGGAVVVGASLSERGLLEAVFVDLAGNKLFGIDVPLTYPAAMTDFAADVGRALEVAITASPFERSNLSRIGISIPALIDSQGGVVHQIATFPVESVPFANIIGNRLNLPVTIENDITCMARSEHWFGCAQDLESFSLLFVDYAIGSAEYVDGLPRFGINGLNSEIGHTKTACGPDAPQCYCGQKGCVSSFSSMYGMVRRWGRFSELTGESIFSLRSTFQSLLDHAEASDPAALAVIDTAATHLGIVVANHVNATDPGTVLILTGSRRLQCLLAEKVMTIAEQNILGGILPRTKILFEVANPDWRWKGTAALALEKLYLDEALADEASRLNLDWQAV
jgi:predicted NBD/HSP70 family sugar kinase